MKKFFILFLAALLTVSCNFLDVVPDDTATLADAFKNENTAEGFLFTCYAFQFAYNNFRDRPGIATSNELVGAQHWDEQWFNFVSYNKGLDNSASPIYDLYSNYYRAILQCHIFLENLGAVKPIMISESEFVISKTKWAGEAKFLIAYYHHILFQHYGPVVVNEARTLEKHPRLAVDECVAKIAALYDEAIADLPNSVPSADYGRATKTVAKAMKAKLLLYAASPLFNGNTDYAEFKDKEGKVLVPQTYDKEKWKRAMDAAKEAIDFAEAQGYSLYEWTGNDPLTNKPVATPFRQAYLNTRYLMVDRNNWKSELIWGYTPHESDANSNQRHSVPKGMANRSTDQASPVGALAPSLTAAKIFYTANGLPPESDPSFPWNDRMKLPSGADSQTSTCNLHLNREPRFYAAIGYDRGTYEFNGWGTTEYTLKLRCGNGAGASSLLGGGKNPEPNGCRGPSAADWGRDHFYTGYAVKKIIRPDGQANSSGWSQQDYAWPLMRLADLYLMYIEANAEYNGSLNATAKAYLTKIHQRAGIPDRYHDQTGTTLIESVRRERMIELIFEGQWHYDLRRWKKAKSWHAGEAEGMWGLYDLGQTAETFYQEVRCPRQPYVFNDRNYLMPIKTSYVNTNELLVQNPGY
jgi:hypothetical protein